MIYSDAIHQAFRDWNDGQAYTDGRNYRVKLGVSTSGPIAPWNREVKRVFATCSEFHRAAKTSAGNHGDTKPTCADCGTVIDPDTDCYIPANESTSGKEVWLCEGCASD